VGTCAGGWVGVQSVSVKDRRYVNLGKRAHALSEVFVQQEETNVGRRTRYYAAVLVSISLTMLLTIILGGCGRALPVDAKEALFSGFESDDNATIYSARQAEPLQQDLDMGADEIWCVNVTFKCWSCVYGQYQTCADSRLMRRINGEWQVSLVVSEDDKEKWEARGCELIEDTVAR